MLIQLALPVKSQAFSLLVHHNLVYTCLVTYSYPSHHPASDGFTEWVFFVFVIEGVEH
jgi:hypothetical protein